MPILPHGLNLLRGLTDIFLPRHCAVTGRPLGPDEPGPVCADVLREVKLCDADYCRRCGAPQGEGVGVIKGCLSCNDNRRGFGTREIVAAGRYRDELAELCLALKFGGERGVAEVLAAWLAPLLIERGVADKIAVVVPVPLSATRRLQRGYNQAEELAVSLAGRLNKPCMDALRRMRHTPRQALLSPAQRRAGVKDVFTVRPRAKAHIEGCRVLLVDDVMTTGATLAACARTLKRARARGVFGAVAARAALGDGP